MTPHLLWDGYWLPRGSLARKVGGINLIGLEHWALANAATLAMLRDCFVNQVHLVSRHLRIAASHEEVVVLKGTVRLKQVSAQQIELWTTYTEITGIHRISPGQWLCGSNAWGASGSTGACSRLPVAVRRRGTRLWLCKNGNFITLALQFFVLLVGELTVVAAGRPLRPAAIEFVHVLKVAAGDEGAEVFFGGEAEEAGAAADRRLAVGFDEVNDPAFIALDQNARPGLDRIGREKAKTQHPSVEGFGSARGWGLLFSTSHKSCRK